jgi:hypothetical protein
VSDRAFRIQPTASLFEVQQEIARWSRLIGPLAFCRRLEGVTVQTTQTAIPHGLGYAPREVLVTLGETAGVIQTAAPDATNVYLRNTGAAAITCNLAVG